MTHDSVSTNGGPQLSEFDFQMKVFGCALNGPNEFAATVAEGTEAYLYGPVEPWDRTDADLRLYKLYAASRQLPTPYWWALPAVTDLILRTGKVALRG